MTTLAAPADRERRGRRRLVAVLLVLAATLLCWYRILGYGFTDVDTYALIATGRVHSAGDLAAILTRPSMQGREATAVWYRPLTALSYGLDEAVWGLRPFGYHLTDLLLHALNGLLVLLLGRRLWRRFKPGGGSAAADAERVPLLAALLFAVHPVHLENVPAIARRSDLLAAAGALAALVAVLAFVAGGRRRCYVAALVATLAAMTAKESGLVVPALVGLLLLAEGGLKGWHRAARLTAPFAAIAVAFLAWRTNVLGGLGGYEVVGYPLPRRLLYSLWHHLLGLALPGFSAAWGPLVATAQEMAAAHPLLTAAVAALLVFEAWRLLAPGPWDGASVRLAAFLLGAPALVLVVYLPAVFVPRYLYLTVAFFALLLAWALVAGWRSVRARWPRPDARGVALTLLVLAATTLAASLALTSPLLRLWPNDKWRDSAAIGTSALAQAHRLLADVPAGTTVYLVDWPYRLRDPRAMPLTVIQLEHSVQAWADLVFPERHLAVVGLCYLSLEGPPARLGVRIALRDRLLAVDVLTGGEATRYPWQRLYGTRDEDALYRYLGPPAGPSLRIALSPQALDRPAVFLVYLGDRVALRRPGAWTLVASPVVARPAG